MEHKQFLNLNPYLTCVKDHMINALNFVRNGVSLKCLPLPL